MVKFFQNKEKSPKTTKNLKNFQKRKVIFKNKKIFDVKKYSNKELIINSKTEWNFYYEIDKKIFLKYGNVIFSDLYEKQKKFPLISKEKILRHKITPENRLLLIIYTLELINVLPNKENTFFQIIYLFDKFLEKTDLILDDNLSKIYFYVCFELALKMESSVIFDSNSNIADLFCIENKNIDNLLELELQILQTIDFELNIPNNILDFYQISLYDFKINVPEIFIKNEANKILLDQTYHSTILISKLIAIDPNIFYNYKTIELNAALIIFANSMACSIVKNYDKNIINIFEKWMKVFIENSRLDIKIIEVIYNSINNFYDNFRKKNYNLNISFS